MTDFIHQLEAVVADLFDEIFPIVRGKNRGVKPLLAPVLGCLVPSPTIRRLSTQRDYLRLDFEDFLDYATSSLPAPPTLSLFSDGHAAFYQSLTLPLSEPLISLPWFSGGLGIIDAALARSGPFVSVTMRFQNFGDLPACLLATTITFAAMPESRSSRDPEIESAPLVEWDRYTILGPDPGETEWRFIMSGVYTDYLLDEMQAHLYRPATPSPQIIENVRETGAENHDRFGGLFELARLGLYLPSYIDFMYDLVADEPVSISTSKSDRPRKRSRKRVSRNHAPKFRVIKSVRIIRPHVEIRPSTRSWTPPPYSYAVAGHWRSYQDKSVCGHDPAGNVVFGKTWVSGYTKGTGRPPRSEDTDCFVSEPGVVISIKQSLAYGRDVIAAHSATQSPAPPAPGKSPKNVSSHEKPTIEWMATERSKLTAGLRFLIMKRDSFRCQLCGRSAAEDSGIHLEVDHKTAVSAWGRTVEDNLWTLCRECNRGKRDLSLGT